MTATPTAISTLELSRGLDLLALHRAAPARYPYLLESAASGTPQGRYDILFACPGRSLRVDANYQLFSNDKPVDGEFLPSLDAWWARHRRLPLDTELPFSGGWFLYLGYELAQQIEPSLRLPRHADAFGIAPPVAFATRVPAAVVRCRNTERVWAVAEHTHAELLAALAGDVANLGRRNKPPAEIDIELDEEAGEIYRSRVRAAREYIFAGDIFQANLSRGWRTTIAGDPDALDVDLYARLRDSNPGPFAGLLRETDFAVLSSSPERLVSVRGDRVQTRPIAGTRPRGIGLGADRALSRELLGHPKERAEHIMLIDLERNDLGRICRPGSVEVNELMGIETYAHVHHIVSNVRGRLRPEVTPGQVIAAVFPGGTITGCPKVRCMEIIAELEAEARGPYTGSMGYLNRDGSMDLNILIRSIVRAGDRLSLRAGGGIVADSDPRAELAETRAKARGLLLAMGAASG